MKTVVHHGDALAVLKTLEAESFDLVLTDPPYSSGGMYRGDRMVRPDDKYTQTTSERRFVDFTGDNRDQRSFLTWCFLWQSECLRVLKPGGVIACFTDWRQYPTMSDALQVSGFVWRGASVWAKTTARPCLGRPSQSCEFVLWGTKGPRAVEGELVRGHVSAAEEEDGPILGVDFVDGHVECIPPRERAHQTQKPIEVLRNFVRLAPPGGRVLDPFAGSGSTLRAAELEGREAVGIELSDVYVRCARGEVVDTVRTGQATLF